MITTHFQNVDLYDMIETVAAVTFDDVTKRLAGTMEEERSAISIVNPIR